MSYLDVYFSRINHLGETTGERIRNGGIRSFEKWLAESPHTIRNLSVERGIYFEGIVLTNKDKEHEKIMFLNVANNIPLLIGDIMNWTLDDGTIEKWILVQEEKKVNGTFRTFWIVRCNYLMKWIDSKGHLQQSWSYFVSSLDSKIKGNFRTWNSLITPQPNKYAELLLPRYPIDIATNFIVEKESWTVVEYDHTSVPGIMYLSLTEGKINSYYDDVENSVADIDRLADYQLEMPLLTQIFHLNDIIKPVFSLIKNGEPCNEEVELLSTDKTVVRKIDNNLVAVGEGITTIIVQLKVHPEIQKTIEIQVGSGEQEFSAYIEGSDTIRLDREQQYILKGFETINNVTFILSNETYAKIVSQYENTCIIHANANNKLGKVILKAIYNNQEFEKEIKIIPLW